METVIRKIKVILTGFHFVMVLSLIFALSILIYLIVSQYHIRIDFTEEEIHSLSRETRIILSDFGKDPIEIHAFYPADHPLRRQLEDLLEEYAYVDPEFQYFNHDPDREPKVAQKFKIDTYGIIVIRARNREVRIEVASEHAVTNALAKILSSESHTIAYVTGHDEPGIEDSGESGYLNLRTRLVGERYQVKEINLLQNGIPDQTDLLILAGPHTDLTVEELKLLRQYFNQGGHLLFALDPVLPGEGFRLKRFLTEYGIELGNDVIVDHLSKEVGADYLVAMLTEYPDHPALENFGSALFFPVARSVRRAMNVPSHLRVTELARTSLGSWAETNLADLEAGEVNYDEGVDLPGPVSLAAVVETNLGSQTLVVLGDSDMLNNANINLAGNRYFFMKLVRWLLDDKPLVNIEQRAAPQYLLFLTSREERQLFLTSVVIIPATFLACGLFIHIWRRRYQ